MITAARLLVTVSVVVSLGLLYPHVGKSSKRKGVGYSSVAENGDAELNRLADELLLEDLSLDDLSLLSEEIPSGSDHRKLTLYRDLNTSDPLKRGDYKNLGAFRFAHIPKTGGTFIEELFKKRLRTKVGMYNKDLILGRQDKHSAKTLRSTKCVFWHYPLTNVIKLASETTFLWGRRWLNTPKFAVIRNPVGRLISEYNYLAAAPWGLKMILPFCKSCAKETLAQDLCSDAVVNEVVMNILKHVFDRKNSYYEDCHFVPQIYYLTDTGGSQHVRYILRQENLTAEIQDFLSHFGTRVTDEEIRSFGGNHEYPPCRAKSSQLNKETLSKIISVYEDDFLRLGYPFPDLPES